MATQTERAAGGPAERAPSIRPARGSGIFSRQELTPYPGRAWVVGRVTISATIVMLLVMTFRIPGGFLGAIFTLFI